MKISGAIGDIIPLENELTMSSYLFTRAISLFIQGGETHFNDVVLDGPKRSEGTVKNRFDFNGLHFTVSWGALEAVCTPCRLARPRHRSYGPGRVGAKGIGHDAHGQGGEAM